MAFVHETGSAEDQQQVAELAKSLREDFLPGYEEWAIDRERDAFLVCFSTGRLKEVDVPMARYALFWEGALIPFKVRQFGTAIDNDKSRCKETFEQFDIAVPESLSSKRKEVLGLIKEALTVYSLGGPFVVEVFVDIEAA